MAIPYPPRLSLALLGGEGLRAEAASLWHGWLLAQAQARRALVLYLGAPNDPPGSQQRRASLIASTLSGLGFAPEVVDPTAVASAPLPPVDWVYLSGNPRVLCQQLPGTALWESLRSGLRTGLVLVAAGGGAVALGELAFAPTRPYPAALDALEFEPLPGLNLLPGTVILPYFNWLQPTIIERIVAHCPPGSLLIGLDDQAALVACPDGWEIAGVGAVSIFRPGEAPRVLDAATPVPPAMLPPSLIG